MKPIQLVGIFMLLLGGCFLLSNVLVESSQMTWINSAGLFIGAAFTMAGVLFFFKKTERRIFK